MRNIIRIIILVFVIYSLSSAQAYLYIHSGNEIMNYDLSDVDSITFNTSGDTILINLSDRIDAFFLNQVDTMMFTGDTAEKNMRIDLYSGLKDHQLGDIDNITFDRQYYDSTGTVTDIDGNVYKTVKIGSQWWTAENLKVTHYNNGDSLINETVIRTWYDLTVGAYCSYDHDSNNAAIYGYLYNWYAVGDDRNLAPAGWHVPTDEEWKQLEMYFRYDPVNG